MAFLDELRKNLSEVSDTVVKKSSHMMEIQKAKLKKVSLESDLKDLYAELGKSYFDYYADGDIPKEMAGLCKKITACRHAIQDAEQRAAFLRGVIVCANCQAEVDKTAFYCPKCGAEIVHVVEDEETAETVDEDEFEEEFEEDKAENEAEAVEPEDADISAEEEPDKTAETEEE